ncbi:Ubiquinone/menaquinone biosynthesis C-methylase UbiE [Micromonospora echinaurantiaca]|uniref:Ubiquinone/menaquinone biosynthesis C-methylase UbiE n=1 Tax=Micromonospora echinaurantiaca TaxID=47857 RepID=A0A1C5GQD8_9ACTN|nr:class I SAM-dependent methyltransferase [Micromonospora echinaurantiaca]SCG35989.1 Ubiquinone/menaquinone biosynthesis C-methylase UbiE [Micromonospora echinaurantiaca]
MRHGEFRDPRLVTVYDAECTWSRDDDYFLAVVGEAPARVLDLGCGTGRLTLALAAAGHTVTGVDPAAASLAAARAKPGAERVTWIEGTSARLPDRAYDVAVLTSHVAQFLVTDAEWAATLADLRRALVPGGRLVFDARDPADRRWERWNPDESRRWIALTDGGVVRGWTEVTAVTGGVVSFVHHYLFPGGDELLSSATVRFRTEEELRGALRAAGFTVERIHGGWGGEPVGQGDGEFIVQARAGGDDLAGGAPDLP